MLIELPFGWILDRCLQRIHQIGALPAKSAVRLGATAKISQRDIFNNVIGHLSSLLNFVLFMASEKSINYIPITPHYQRLQFIEFDSIFQLKSRSNSEISFFNNSYSCFFRLRNLPVTKDFSRIPFGVSK